jgi:hypothetical protein
MWPSKYVEAKAISDQILDLTIRSPRAWHVDTVSVRNLGAPCEVNMMMNDKIKKDNFKINHIPYTEVRSTHISEDIG